jgi:hypothetical protein
MPALTVDEIDPGIQRLAFGIHGVRGLVGRRRGRLLGAAADGDDSQHDKSCERDREPRLRRTLDERAVFRRRRLASVLKRLQKVKLDSVCGRMQTAAQMRSEADARSVPLASPHMRGGLVLSMIAILPL